MWDWIVELVGRFWDKAREVLPGIVGRVMSTLGVTWATIEHALPNFIAFVQSHASGIASDIIALLAYLNVDKVMTMIISAYIVRLSMKVFMSPLRLFTGAGS